MTVESRPEWTADADRRLRALLHTNIGPDEIAAALRREVGEVLNRIA